MEKNKPKFRLEDISKIPEDIKEMIKEIVAEISHSKKLQPISVKSKGVLEEVCVPYVGPCATQSGKGINSWRCDPHCSCNTECDCDDKCNYCKCVDYCKNDDGCSCDDYRCSDITCDCHDDWLNY